MKKPYSLILMGFKPENGFKGVFKSSHMLYEGLRNSFEKLQHVELIEAPLDEESSRDCSKLFNSLPNADFLLIRAFNSCDAVKKLQKLKSKIKYLKCSFIEHSQEQADYCFAFLNYIKPEQIIKLPYIEDYAINVTKNPKKILIDQTPQGYCLTEDDITNIIGHWLYDLRNEYVVYQLVAKGQNPCQRFIKPLQMSNYHEYMNKTKDFKFFIQGKKGSYEHCIMDMASRGIQVLSPDLFGSTYVKTPIIEDLKIKTFNNKESLIQCIQKPQSDDILNNLYKKMNSMEQCVKIIDKKFQEVLDGRPKE